MYEPPSHHRPTSEVLQEIADGDNEYWTTETLSYVMGNRSFGILLVLFSLPNAIPLPIPGLSSVTSLPVLFLAFQLLLGRDYLWFPKRVVDCRISGSTIRKCLKITLPWLRRMERVIKPRLYVLTGWNGLRVGGAVMLVLAIIIALPIPLGNFVPGVAMSLLAIAMCERDGLLMIFALIAAAVAITFSILLMTGYGFLIMESVKVFLAP